jgi:hypothetical protein
MDLEHNVEIGEFNTSISRGASAYCISKSHKVTFGYTVFFAQLFIPEFEKERMAGYLREHL